ncbi:copper resistance protein CopC [Streptomonospora sp. S1-112]|uniref:Copper resistance protein CopC n=1 Tax=Streptomonospora mangrovi TaxID=2883123 RepID=A0A9X3NKQ8_9ACTN|nr:copper resistance CopC family protein [Streptomonospora mangrovi]MDA0565492.1 copper resistance protein CopC [Streptomonospora mangrovi]
MNPAVPPAPALASAPRRRAARRLAVLASALGAAAVLGVGAAPAALAHNTLIDSSPKDEAELDTAPEEVVLTFNADVGEGANAIVVTGPQDGRTYQDGEVTVDGAEASVPLGELDTAGEYTVAYRIVSADGHILEDDLTFTLSEEAVPEPSPSAEDTAAAPEDDSTGSSAPAEESPAATESADPLSTFGPVGAVVGGIAIVALIVILLVRMRRRPGPPAQG